MSVTYKAPLLQLVTMSLVGLAVDKIITVDKLKNSPANPLTDGHNLQKDF